MLLDVGLHDCRGTPGLDVGLHGPSSRDWSRLSRVGNSLRLFPFQGTDNTSYSYGGRPGGCGDVAKTADNVDLHVRALLCVVRGRSQIVSP